jgi:hypothetical protein
MYHFFFAMLLFAFLLGPASTVAAADFTCPSPSEQTGSDIRGDISGKAQTLLRIGDAEVKGTVQKTVVDLFSKYPHSDRVAIINTLISTTCNFIKNSTQLSDAQKIDRWMAVYPAILSLMPSSEQKRSEHPTVNSRIQMAGQELYSKDGMMFVNVHYRNFGDGAAIGVRHGYYTTFASDELLDQQIDEAFRGIKKRMVDLEKSNITSETQPGEQFFFTIPLNQSDNYFKMNVTEGAHLFYLLATLEYRDRNTPHNAWRTTEICKYMWKTEAFHDCGGHNRIYLAQ